MFHDTFIDPNLSQNWNLVLLGNLFTVDNHNDIDWLQSQFEHASNLYLTPIGIIFYVCWIMLFINVV